ncbi:MAG: GNAT family N-acetyltransferase [Phycisphaerae bacterium]
MKPSAFPFLDASRLMTLVDHELELVEPEVRYVDAVLSACHHPLTRRDMPAQAQTTRETLMTFLSQNPRGRTGPDAGRGIAPGYTFWMRIRNDSGGGRGGNGGGLAGGGGGAGEGLGGFSEGAGAGVAGFSGGAVGGVAGVSAGAGGGVVGVSGGAGGGLMGGGGGAGGGLTGAGVVIAGSVSLRIGHSPNLDFYLGHIGYHVLPPARGRHYAERACRLLLPLARAHEHKVVWITCNPENAASRRTCERLGAKLVETVMVPRDNPLYGQGDRQKCRYRLEL